MSISTNQVLEKQALSFYSQGFNIQFLMNKSLILPQFKSK